MKLSFAADADNHRIKSRNVIGRENEAPVRRHILCPYISDLVFCGDNNICKRTNYFIKEVALVRSVLVFI